MTGRTHDQIAAAGALGVGVALRLPLEHSAVLLTGALAAARAPDYVEPVVRAKHRTVTHYLLTGLAVALAFLAAAVFLAPLAYAAAWALGVLVGWSLHSLADACTDRGCWLWKRQRQVLLPDAVTIKILRWRLTWHPRIRVYTITKRKHWLTRKVTTTKRPSAGEQLYGLAATLAAIALGGVQLVTALHDLRPLA